MLPTLSGASSAPPPMWTLCLQMWTPRANVSRVTSAAANPCLSLLYLRCEWRRQMAATMVRNPIRPRTTPLAHFSSTNPYHSAFTPLHKSR